MILFLKLSHKNYNIHILYRASYIKIFIICILSYFNIKLLKANNKLYVK